jgi:1-acyl-sn-glycerol-3-phosphate acyltransferase
MSGVFLEKFFIRLAKPLYIGGCEHIPLKGGFIIAANHLSFMDPPVIGAAVPRPVYYFARDTLFLKPWVSLLLTQLNGLPYKRDSEGDAASMKKILKLLRAGEGLLLFIEGTRSLDGQLQKPKPGIGLMACRTQVPIVPARVFNTHHMLNHANTQLNFTVNSSVMFGPALMPADYDPGVDALDRYLKAAYCVAEAIEAITL